MRLCTIIENYLIEHPEISLSELARRAGVSKGYLSMIKAGKDPRGNEIHPTAAKLNLIAKAMGRDLDWLIDNLDTDYKIVVNASPRVEDAGFVANMTLDHEFMDSVQKYWHLNAENKKTIADHIDYLAYKENN